MSHVAQLCTGIFIHQKLLRKFIIEKVWLPLRACFRLGLLIRMRAGIMAGPIEERAIPIMLSIAAWCHLLGK